MTFPSALLVPKLHLGTSLSPQLRCLRPRSTASQTSAFPSTTWERGGRVESNSPGMSPHLASTPTGLMILGDVPKVGASHQPWAECLQPLQGCPNQARSSNPVNLVNPVQKFFSFPIPLLPSAGVP